MLSLYWKVYHPIKVAISNFFITDKHVVDKELSLTSYEWMEVIAYIAKCEGVYLNHTQHHKILYICYMILLCAKNIAICEKPVAFPFGPVFKKSHQRIIRPQAITAETYEKIKSIHPEILQIFELTVRKVCHSPVVKLVNWACRDTSAWHIHSKIHKYPWGTKMTNYDILNEGLDYLITQE